MQPQSSQWKSLLTEDAYVNCQKATIGLSTLDLPIRSYSLSSNGTLKSPKELKREITRQSSDFFTSLSHKPNWEEKDSNLLNKSISTEITSRSKVEPITTSQRENRARTSTNVTDTGKFILSLMAEDDMIESSSDNYSRPRKHSCPEKSPKLFSRQESISTIVAKKPGTDGRHKRKLLEILTFDGLADIRFTLEFLMIYPYFSTCKEVLSALQSGYKSPKFPQNISDEMKNAFVSQVQAKIRLILKRWIEFFPSHFIESGCVPQLFEFICSLGESEDICKLKQLSATLKVTVPPVPIFVGLKSYMQTKLHILDHSIEVLAQQLSLADQKMFCSIDFGELKGQKWIGESAVFYAPRTTRCIQYFNRVSYWCATQIITHPFIKTRVQVIEKLLRIAKMCRSYGNFNTMFAIVSCMNLVAVNRLKATWKALPRKYHELHEKLKLLCNVETHYLPYKELLLQQTPPLVPYLGVFLRDLTFIEVGNPNYLDDSDRILNYDKFRMLASVLHDIRKYQQIQYKFEPLEDIQTLIEFGMETLDEDTLFLYSQQVESLRTSLPRERRSVASLFHTISAPNL